MTLTGLTARQSQIIAQIRVDGRVEVDALAAAFAVTTQTIRRDLNELSQAGLLARVHGGAILAPRAVNVAYAARRVDASAEKQAIGRRAAQRIPENCSVALTIGTTVEEVARVLTDRRDLLVVTSNLNIPPMFRESRARSVLIAGGDVRLSDGAVIGEDAAAFFRKFKVDFAVIGCSAMDEDGSIMDFDPREVSVARAVIENARQTILVADRQKFDRTAPARICPLGDLSAIVMDQPPPAAFAARCDEAGVALDVTSSSADFASASVLPAADPPPDPIKELLQ